MNRIEKEIDASQRRRGPCARAGRAETAVTGGRAVFVGPIDIDAIRIIKPVLQ